MNAQEQALNQRKKEIIETYQHTINYYEVLKEQIYHLDKFVDLGSYTIYAPLGILSETVRSFCDCLDDGTEESLNQAHDLGSLMQSQTNQLKNSVDQVLAQGIDFLRLPGYADADLETISSIAQSYEQSLYFEDTDQPEA